MAQEKRAPVITYEFIRKVQITEELAKNACYRN